MLLGTLEYMSPEQASGRPVDARADQFAVGLILAEMATGQPVFRRDTPGAGPGRGDRARGRAASTPAARTRPRPSRRSSRGACRRTPALRFEKTDELAAQLCRLAGRSRAASLAGVPLTAGPGARDLRGDRAAAAPPPSCYHVQTGADGSKVKRYDERLLVSDIRDGKLTGVELVRRDDEEVWQPLFESHVFRREVPNVGNPREAAGWRALRALGGSLDGVRHHIGRHGLPGRVSVLAGDLGWAARPAGARHPPEGATSLEAAARGGWTVRAARASRGRSAATAPAARGRPTLADRAGGGPRARPHRGAGGQGREPSLAEVDDIVKREAELAERQADLEEQTSEAERAALSRSSTQAQARWTGRAPPRTAASTSASSRC